MDAPTPEQKFEKSPKPMGLEVNKEQVLLLIRGLRALPDSEKSGVIYSGLLRDLETMNTIWDRIIKNQKLANQQRREATLAKRGIQPKSNQQHQ